MGSSYVLYLVQAAGNTGEQPAVCPVSTVPDFMLLIIAGNRQCIPRKACGF